MDGIETLETPHLYWTDYDKSLAIDEKDNEYTIVKEEDGSLTATGSDGQKLYRVEPTDDNMI